MGRSVYTGVVVKLQAVGYPRVVQYRPQLQYCMMQYKGELGFSLYCITFFSLSTVSVGSWTSRVVHDKLPLVLLPPGIVVGGPLSWAGLTVVPSRTLQSSWVCAIDSDQLAEVDDGLLVCLSSVVFFGCGGSWVEG